MDRKQARELAEGADLSTEDLRAALTKALDILDDVEKLSTKLNHERDKDHPIARKPSWWYADEILVALRMPWGPPKP